MGRLMLNFILSDTDNIGLVVLLIAMAAVALLARFKRQS